MMITRKILFYLAFFVAAILFAAWGVNKLAFTAAPTPTPEQIQVSPEAEAVKKAIEKAIEGEKTDALALLLYDTHIERIIISEDGQWATAWMVPVDQQTGEVIPLEPGLALARRTDQGWAAFLPSDPLWLLVMREMPVTLVPQEQKREWFQIAELGPAAVTAPIGGYYLPYAGGDTMSLTQSVGHDRYTPSGSAHFAFDFAKPGYPSGMFNVHAARGGIVRQAVWTHPNGNEANSNYIVLEDTSTTPTTYQLYMHLAQNSIPEGLRRAGAPVRQGQFIGIADDTGVSSGNHLHFMVHTTSASYWGTSIDITFNDVSINGGRPRIASDLAYCRRTDICNSTQTTYLSQNFMSPDHIPPVGGISNPPHGSTISNRVLPLQGWAADENSGIYSAQFKALFNGQWQDIGSPFNTNNFSLDWDMCSVNVPDGPISVALTIRDKAQNLASGLPGLIHYSKNYSCPEPASACIPAANQVTLFAGPDFQGKCVKLSAGAYNTSAQLAPVGDDNVESILVGSNVQATLFSNSHLQGRGETFYANDVNLADNHVGANTVTSALVQTRTTTPPAPTLIWPANNASYPSDASFSLSWESAGSAAEFQLELLFGSTQVLLTPWEKRYFWHLSPLPPGAYTWRVKARNASGQAGSWSGSRTLNITQAAPPPTNSINVPFSDSMDGPSNNWSAVNWTLSSQANRDKPGSLGWKYDMGSANGYDNGSPNSGYLTSAPINIPAGGNYYLRFYYQAETESAERHWDQRWVQISANGGPYANVLQLSDDPKKYWLRSPAISLAQYAGQIIRVRFFFSTLDNAFNHFTGWYIDDVSVTNDPPPACIDADNSPAQATLIEYGQVIHGKICPNGDLDFYRFQAVAGDQVGIRLQAKDRGSPLDTTLVLLDSDGSSIIAENDDLVQYERSDSFISYKVQRTGAYYIKVKAWDHPEAGGPEYTYTLSLHNDRDDPTASFTNPVDGGVLTTPKTELRVAARDTNSGVSLVRFYYHTDDWLNPEWVYLGEDWDPADGWNYTLDSSVVPFRNGMAVYAVVYDWAGNWIGTGAWNLHLPMIYFPIIIKSR